MRTLAWIAIFGAAITFAQHHNTTDEPAAAIFKKQCSNCHVTPDPKFEADRAYIRQIYETA